MATTGVDAIWWTVSQIAERDGVSKQAISKAVAKLADSGLEVRRNAQDRVSLVNVVDFDRKRGRYADPSKAQAPAARGRGRERDESGGDSYDEALRQKTWHEAEMKRLALAEQRGSLVRIERLEEAVEAALEAIVRVVDRLPNATDDLATAVAREGAHGLRVALRKKASAMRHEIAAALREMAAEQPKHDEEDHEGIGGR